MTIVPQVLSTVSDIMSFMAPSAGGAVPDATSDEYAQWLMFIQVKQEEASRRGFWRRLLIHDTVALVADDEYALMPVQFQRANSLYIFYADGIDYADPDREPDDQSIFAEVINDPDDSNFGRWKLTFATPIATTQTADIWYWAEPPKPVLAGDKVLLPGDMIAFGALSEVFRTTNLEGSQDDARTEYENRLSTYLAMEMIPARNEILAFVSNPSRVDRTVRARLRYTTRVDRVRRF